MENLFALFYECAGVCTDTRNVLQDGLFIALKGTNFNGNSYAVQAIEKGAKYSIVDEQEIADGKQIFYVGDTLIFLQKLAEYHRNKFNIPIIGITGSNGKTTTKELIAVVLSKKYKVLFTSGNFNNHIGVPLTLLRLTDAHEIAIIEMGASKLGDIKELTDIAHPNYGIITNVGTAHIEGFSSRENIFKTKIQLFNAVSEQGGHIFCNSDDTELMEALPRNIRLSTYGRSEKASIFGEVTRLSPNLNFKWATNIYQSPDIETQIIGKYNLHNILAAVCVGNYFGVDFNMVNDALHEYSPNNNRSQLLITESNQLILDAYNANPTSVYSALENFAEIESNQNKFFILGDMLELGENAVDYHQKIIDFTKVSDLQGFFVGYIYAELATKNDIQSFKTVEEAKIFFKSNSAINNLILLKGSRGIGLEKLVEVF